MKPLMKTLALVTAALLLAGLGTQMVEASAAYDGYNSIGSYSQYQYGYRGYDQGGYRHHAYRAPGDTLYLDNPRYYYPTQPRAGGWFGGGSGWLAGLRAPTYDCVPPVNYPTGYRPTCGGSYGGSSYAYSAREEYESTSISFGFY